MPRVQTRKAKFDTYRHGKQVPCTRSKSGFRVDRSQPEDEHDSLFCKKGDTYYTWSFRYGGTHRSTTYPRPSQLTQSEFWSTVYSAQEAFEDLKFPGVEDCHEDLKNAQDELASEIRQAGEEAQSSLDNMPEGLEDGDTGQMLQERADTCDTVADEIEGVDLDDLETLVNEKGNDEDGEDEIQEAWENLKQNIMDVMDVECE